MSPRMRELLEFLFPIVVSTLLEIITKYILKTIKGIKKQ
jgi:hypothetical protein